MTPQAKILIVDDDPVLVKATTAVLESANYKVVAAYDGEEGLAKVASDKPDLIILDVIMPNKDGFAVCEQLKGDNKYADIPVIMLTSFAEKKGETSIPVSAGLTLEAEDYIDKPVKPDELLFRVARLLKKKGMA